MVNLVGILTERRRGDFQRVHAEGAGAIARAGGRGRGRAGWCRSRRSAPTRPAPALYGRSKAAGEEAVREAFPAATILRPSVVFGPEDQFFNRFGRMAMLLPVMPVICGDTRFQPVYRRRRGGRGHAPALQREDAPGQLYELGGPRVWTFRELLH